MSPAQDLTSATAPWAGNAAGTPIWRTGAARPAAAAAWAIRVPTPPATLPSSTVTTSRACRASSTSPVGDRRHPARVDDPHREPGAARGLGGGERIGGDGADGDDEDVDLAGAVLGEHVDAAPRVRTAGRSAVSGVFGKRTTVGPPLQADGLAQLLAQPGLVARGGDPDARHDAEDGEIPHPVVRRAVLAGDAGAVEHEGDRQPVQRDVEQHLVEGAVEEGRVERPPPGADRPRRGRPRR